MKKDIGIYRKYTVTRTDKQDEPGKKHEGCDYFVLDLTHDKFAIPALEAYAAACEKALPVLSKDLKTVIKKIKSKGRPKSSLARKFKFTHKCDRCDFRYSVKPEMVDKYGDHATMCPKHGCGGTLQPNKKR